MIVHFRFQGSYNDITTAVRNGKVILNSIKDSKKIKRLLVSWLIRVLTTTEGEEILKQWICNDFDFNSFQLKCHRI